jgi:basic membrane protein A
MFKSKHLLTTLLIVVFLMLAACNTAADPTEEAAPEATEVMDDSGDSGDTGDDTGDTGDDAAAIKVCQVTDVGGIDDKSFNATAWSGVENAVADFGVEGKFLESQQQTDYEKNINAFIEDECDLIVTVGFLLGDATAAAAEANPDVNLAIVDFAYDPGYDNVLGMVFAVDQASFLAGYVAAAATQTGIVGTFGGINIPPVTAFMDGYVLGVRYHNQTNGTDVQVLGWDLEAQDGLFTGNFESTDDGRAFGESLMDEGADVIMPVAGPVGLGTAAAIQERGSAWIIGVDTDWTVSAAEFGDIVLTSVLKNMNISVYDAAGAVVDGTFAGGLYVGTLENGGVGVADPAIAVDGIDGLIDGIISGSIATLPGGEAADDGGGDAAAIKVCQVTDVGGIDDKSFNATAWEGVENAIADFGVEGKFLESQQQTDYEKNINAFIEDECDLIVTVGFLLGDATAVAAETNPDVNLAIVDFAYDPGYDNVLGMVFAVDQASFLAGYVAAAATQTGIVGTFGGINIPPVTAFMDGYVLGVRYHNEVNGTDVQVLGWDLEAQDGLFTGNFESTDDGRAFAESLMDEGADVIMPVAGPVGLGSAAAIQDRGNAWLVGVDTDWTVSAPEFGDIVLTSVLKNMNQTVYDAISAIVDSTFAGGLYVGTLENGGVGIADPAISVDGLDAIIAGIIDGSIATLP